MRKTAGLIAVAATVVAAAPNVAFARPGDLDRSFGGDGRVHTGLLGWDVRGSDLGVQANGKIVAVGTATLHEDPADSSFAFFRYWPRYGTHENYFGWPDGKGTANFTTGHDNAAAVAVRRNRTIIVAGTADASAPDRAGFAWVFVHFTGDAGQMAMTNLPDARWDRAADVAIQEDGKIVVAGSAYFSDGDFDRRFVLLRYTPNGELDPTFGDNGVVTTAFPGAPVAPSFAAALAVQPDGDLLVAGAVGEVGEDEGLQTTVNMRFALARYDSTGALDPTFGQDGLVTTNFTSVNDYANAVALHPNGKIVVCGAAGRFQPSVGAGAEPNFALARYQADGTPDTTFSGDGKLTTRFSRRAGECADLAIQANGRIVATGSVFLRSMEGLAGAGNSALARYRANGALDRTFGGDGRVLSPIGDPETASAILLQGNDERIVTVGTATRGRPQREVLTLARYRSR